MILLEKDRYLLTGVGPFATIVDSDLNLIYSSNMKYENNNTGIDLGIYRPDLVKLDSNTIIATDALPYLGNNYFEQINFRLNLIGDSIYIDSFLLQSNDEQMPKLNPVSTGGKLNDYYVATNEGEETGSYKNNFSSNFYISKCNGLKQIWKKSFGGNYYFRVFDIEYLAEDAIIVVGSVFDYYKNGILNGFYLVINSEGDIILSNQNLTSHDFNIYPNTSTGELNLSESLIDFMDNSEYKVKLYSGCGDLIVNDIQVSNNSIDLREVPGGFYILSISNKDKTYSSKVQIYRP